MTCKHLSAHSTNDGYWRCDSCRMRLRIIRAGIAVMFEPVKLQEQS